LAPMVYLRHPTMPLGATQVMIREPDGSASLSTQSSQPASITLSPVPSAARSAGLTHQAWTASCPYPRTGPPSRPAGEPGESRPTPPSGAPPPAARPAPGPSGAPRSRRRHRAPPRTARRPCRTRHSPSSRGARARARDARQPFFRPVKQHKAVRTGDKRQPPPGTVCLWSLRPFRRRESGLRSPIRTARQRRYPTC
jgi:hypothetical protein